MKKIALFGIVMLCSFLHTSALVCTDIQKNVSRFQESSTVLSLQQFLYEKGYLKVTPNGYFGLGTLAAVKQYQKSLGVEQVGSVGPFTRAAIKRETCVGQTSTTSTPKQAPSSVTSTPVTSIAQVTPVTPAALRNATRRADLEKLLQALYTYYVESRGVFPTNTKSEDIFTELCVRPKPAPVVGTTTEVAVLVTPVSPCADYVDITHLIPSYLHVIPRDPQLATSSMLTGYTLNRSENNDITLSSLKAEDRAIVKVTCNFTGYCRNIKHISSVIYKQPTLASTSVNLLLRDSFPKKQFTIYGTNFTATNTVTLLSQYTGKSYTLGTFASTNGTSFEVTASSTNQLFYCGQSCEAKIPLGDYILTVSNQGGITTPAYITLKGFTTSALSARSDTSVRPKSAAVKVGTFTVSSGIPLVLKSLTLTSTTTSTNLPSKITKLTLKDALTGQTVGVGGLSFSLANVSLYENQSKVYELYIDVGEVLVADSGSVTYGGTFLVGNTLTGVDAEIPSKEITFTVSY